MLTDNKQWHSCSIESTLEILGTSLTGLSATEANQRFLQYGYNQLPKEKKRHWLKRFLSQFQNVLIYILIFAAIISAVLGKKIDTAVILLVVVIDVLIGFIQEGKAESALHAIRKMLSLQTTVIRDKKRFVISGELLVPGDIVLLQPGDKVPADLRLINVKNLQVNESLLTGESMPVLKNANICHENTAVSDRLNMAFSGTLITAGYATGVVVATGNKTEIGRIGKLLSSVKTVSTPLLLKMKKFSQVLSIAIVGLSAFVFLFGFLIRGYDIERMLMTAVAIAVAAIPEGLPIILTITLAIGVQRMAARHAIIRRLPAVETLGSVTVICTDKTGTLTKNEMTVRTVCMDEHNFHVNGTGYLPQGNFFENEKLIDLRDHSGFIELCRAAMLCNEATFHLVKDQLELHGDPTEGALIILGMKAGIDVETLKGEFPTTDIIPFESEHRFMATLHHDHKGNGVIYVKGAPEVIFPRCDIDVDDWHKKLNQITQAGERVLAIARKSVSIDHQALLFSDIESDLVLLGVVGIIDPPRDEAVKAIKECQSAGILVKMITGDHAKTANAIALQMGISDGSHVITGGELESLSERDFSIRALHTNVFARTSPACKLRLVEALQSHHHVVAMTGDGVNDAPALKRAEIGVAMGLKGSEAAKEASEMVLTDDNFASIVAAIKEGRTVFDNVKKVILFLLPINGGECASLIVATLFGLTLPITPLQILWINMVSSVTLTMALAFEPSEPNVMDRPPVSNQQSLLSRALAWKIVFVSMIFLAGIFGVFEWSLLHGRSIETARTLSINTLVMLEVWYLFSSRYVHGPSLTVRGVRGTKAVLTAVGLVCILQAVFTYTAPMQLLFETRALSFYDAVLIGFIGVVGFFIFEADKLLQLRWKSVCNLMSCHTMLKRLAGITRKKESKK